MPVRRSVLIAASLAGLMLALCVGQSAAPVSAHRVVTIRTLAHPIVIAGNYQLDPPPTGYVPTIAGNRAVAIGLGDVTFHPSSTVATLVVDPTGEPMWIVALHGTCLAPHAGVDRCHAELNVEVSARTGAVLDELSYR